MTKKAILLLNIGTPDNYHEKSVRHYLREFLNDPRVVDLPVFLRWPLVNLLIVPFRYKRVVAAYKKIWFESGSPLLIYTKQLRDALAKKIGDEYQIEFAMRYGNPSIASVMKKLKAASAITIVPLFPQYTSAATGSAIEEVLKHVSHDWNIPQLNISRDFYNHPGFISAYAEIIREHLANKKPDLILFSYHGLPERHLDKSHCKANCDHVHACPPVQENNQYCYRAQCYATSTLLAEVLSLSVNEYSVSFQSRLGRTPWIKPYTDVLLSELIQKGVKRLAIVCPSFVADCLETLEEINIRAREQWQTLGGTELIFIPCLNDHITWINALAGMITSESKTCQMVS